LRIVGGVYRSRQLYTFEGEDVRPTPDKVRESLFNILQFKVRGASFLDLFCGTGAMGIEALSRGASKVTFNDRSKESVALTKKNLKKLGITESVSVVNQDALSLLANGVPEYDIIYIDPPYKTDLGLKAVSLAVNVLKDGGVIIFEDENIMLLDKKPGVSVHEDEKGATNTLITHILAYLYQKGEYNPKEENAFAPALCNRIDRNTGGIVIAAKNAEALRIMNEKIKLREIDKFYLAAIHGTPKKREDTLKAFLKKDEKTKTVRVYDKNPPRDAKTIITKYKVLKSNADTSLVEVELLTGRTHQIRAHLSFIGHPLIGDGKYGINKEDRARGYKYQALYSYRLKFNFCGEENLLTYLSGREFRVPNESIYFLEDFK
jgi:23S rRNA pseudouridine955/2504/2580 synthase